MGWTGSYQPMPRGRAALEAYILKEFPNTSTWEWKRIEVKETRPGREAEVYGAVSYINRLGESGVFGLVVLVEGGATEVRYKEMSEEMLPFYYDASPELIRLLSPHPAHMSDRSLSSAMEWRRRCLKKAGITDTETRDLFQEARP